jgi:hypothetical protein
LASFLSACHSKRSFVAAMLPFSATQPQLSRQDIIPRSFHSTVPLPPPVSASRPSFPWGHTREF